MNDERTNVNPLSNLSPETISASDVFFRVLVENMHEGVTVVNEDDRICYCNESFAAMLGYTREELMGTPRRSILDPSTLAPAEEEFDKRRRGQPSTYEVRLKSKNGSVVTVLVSGVPLPHSAGVFQGSFAVISNITELKAAEEKLREGKEKLEQRVAERTWQLGERIKELNCLLGISRIVERSHATGEDLLQSVVELLPPSWQYPELAGARIVVRDREARSESFLETPFRQKSTLYLYGKPAGFVEVSYSKQTPPLDEGPFLKEERNLIDAVAERLGHVIERMETEKELRESRRKLAESEVLFREFFELGTVGMAVVSPDKKWLRVNQRLTEILGYPQEELLDMSWPEITHPDDVESDVQRFGRLISGEVDSYSLDKRFVHKNGSTVHTSLHVTAVRKNDGSVDRVLAHVVDIGDRIVAEKVLRRSNQDLEQLAYVASHDLREPLRKISNFTELLARKYRGRMDEKADRYIHYIVDGADRMQKLIDDLLVYSRVGRFELNRVRTEIDTLLDKVLSDLEPLVEEHDAVIERSPLPALPADPGQISRVFQNLIQNAIKFRSERRPVIRIRAEQGDNEWIFRIADNGIGIDEFNTDRVFVIFQRLHTREEYPGTGIGLAVCKRIVERHDGRIWVESQPGSGSEFVFTLPAVAET